MSLRSEVIRILNEYFTGNKKISELPAGTTPSGDELIEGVQDGESVSFTISQVSSGGAGVLSIVAGTNVTVDDTDPQNPIVSATGGGGVSDWGDIGGTLSDQTDLQGALDAKQASDSDLTTIAGLTPSNDDFLQRKAGAWANRTIAQVKTDLDLTGTNSGDQTATTVPNTPAGSIVATTVQAAINELDTEKAPLASPTFTGTVTLPAGTIPKVIQVAFSDTTSAITASAGKVAFRMPYAMTVTAVRASLKTAQASGSIFTVDINEGASSILSTKITIDNTEKTSTTAVTPPVISDTSLADDAEITIDVDQVGDGTAVGGVVSIIGY